ncbi:MAG: tRNA-intron lyase [Candidatus Bathyarchaeia archaeon]
MKQKDEDKKEEGKIVIVKAILKEDGVSVPSSEDIEGLSSRGYGALKNDEFMLKFYEALYLLNKGIIEIKDGKTDNNITFQNLLEKYRSIDENAWVKYLIYRDLRSRGYVVREGFGLGLDFRVYERGEYGKDTASFIIFGILEGKPVSVEELAQILKHAQSLKKNLILAVLNRKGEIVYYSLSCLNFE